MDTDSSDLDKSDGQTKVAETNGDSNEPVINENNSTYGNVEEVDDDEEEEEDVVELVGGEVPLIFNEIE